MIESANIRLLGMGPVLMLLAVTAGCAGSAWTQHTAPERTAETSSTEKSAGEQPARQQTGAQHRHGDGVAARSALYAQYRDWEGTRYRYGGMSRRGVDCSGFVALTFRERFDRDLPRSTVAQARQGREVRADQLSAGDLVFFRTGRSQLHVGIYVEDRRFLHASTREGVTLSNLDQPYWRSRFLHARRL